VQVSDSENSDSKNVIVNLININDNPPEIEYQEFSIEENLAISSSVGQVYANDGDSGLNSLLFNISQSTTDSFEIDSNTGELSVFNSNDLDYELSQSYTLTVQVSDTEYTSSASILINLININDNSPQINPQSYSINEKSNSGTVVGLISANDADGDNIQYKIISGNTNNAFEINSETGEILVLSNEQISYENASSYTLSVSAGDGSYTEYANIYISIINLNDNPPQISNQEFIIDENSANNTMIGTVSATDLDNDDLTFEIISESVSNVFTISTDGMLYVKNQENLDYENGTHSYLLTVSVYDGSYSSTAAITININNINDNSPQASDLITSINENLSINSYVGEIIANDGDNNLNALIFSIDSGNTAQAFAISQTNGIIYVNDSNMLDYESQIAYTLTISISDSKYTEFANAYISINNLNDNNPIANNNHFYTNEDESFSNNLTAIDLDNNTLSFEIVSSPTKGLASINNTSTGSFSYSPNENESGTDSFSFIANDGKTNSNTAIITISITPINDAPTANNSNVNTSENQAVKGNFSANDVDNDTLEYFIYSQPSKGIVNIESSNSFVYTPSNGMSGSDSFIFYASDSEASSNTAIVSINIGFVNDAPVAYSNTFYTFEDTPIINQLTTYDQEGDSLVISIQNYPTKGVLTLTDSEQGFFQYTPNLNINGNDSFTFIANDNELDSNTATIEISITPVNDPPETSNLNFNINENQSIQNSLNANDIENQNLIYSIVSHPQKGVVNILNDTTGLFAYTPLENQNGNDEFTFMVNDGEYDSNISTVSLNIAAVNDAPVAYSKTINILEDSQLSYTLNASDSDSQSLTFSIFTNPSKGTITYFNQTSGFIIFNPYTDINGSDSFSYIVNDGFLNSESAAININITPVNDTPVAKNSTISTSENEKISSILSGTDIDGDTITYIIVSSPEKGTLQLDNPLIGSYSYTPNNNENGIDIFTYKVNDGLVDSDFAYVTITINAVNDAPESYSSIFSTYEDNYLIGSLIANDTDNDYLTYLIVQNPQKGTIAITNSSTGTFSYTPDNNIFGNDTFSFKVNDGLLDSNTATITINITPVNDTPTVSDLNINLMENQSIQENLSANDIDNDELTYHIVQQPDKGIVNIIDINQGIFAYTPNTNENGIDEFTFKVNDGKIDSAAGKVNINIVEVNTAPVVQNYSISTLEDNDLSFVLNAVDPDSITIQYIITKNPEKGSIVLDAYSGNCNYSPNENEYGLDSFIFKANDGINESELATVEIYITPVNDKPSAKNINLVTNENTALNSNFTASDPDSISLTYQIIDNPQKGTVIIKNISQANFSYTPDNNVNGVDIFSYIVSDGILNSEPAFVTITISSINDAPESYSSNFTIYEDSKYSGILNSNDIDSENIRFIIVQNPENGTVKIDDIYAGTFSYTPDNNYYGSDLFKFKTNDGSLDSNTAIVSIYITPVNDPPHASNLSFNVKENQSIQSNLNASDIENDNLIFSIVTQPEKGEVKILDINTGSFSYTPNAFVNGSDQFTYKTNDGNDSNIAVVTITILEVNNPPVVYNDSISLLEDSFISYTLKAFDSDSLTLSYSIEQYPKKGILNLLNSGLCVYTPNENESGNDSFIFTASDLSLNSEPAVVEIYITPVNDQPVAKNAIITTFENQSVIGNLTVTDPDNSSFTFIILQNPQKGLISLENNNSGSFTYTPDNYENGLDYFTYKVNDGSIDSDPKTITITISSVNNAPDSYSSNIYLLEDNNYTGTLKAFDPDNSNLSYIIVSNPQKGIITINNISQGNFSYTPDKDLNGIDSFSFKVNDGQLDSNISICSISITPVNDMPVAVSENLYVNEDTPKESCLSASDIDSSNLEFSIVDNPSNGIITIINSSCNYIYTPNENITGTDTFSFIAFDGEQNSLEAQISIIIQEQNDAPTAMDIIQYTFEDTQINGTLIASDIDNTSISFSIFENGQKGNAQITDINKGEFIYIPDLNETGVDTFTYRANDGNLFSEPATVTISITNVNDAPTAFNDNLTISENSSYTGFLNASDIDSISLTYIITASPEKGTVTLLNNLTGEFIYKPDNYETGSDLFSFIVSDGSLDSNIAEITFEIENINNPAIALNADYSTLEDSAILDQLSGYDPDGDQLTYIVVDTPQKGKLTITNPSSGSFAYSPNPDFYGNDSFTFKINDSKLDSNTANVNISITAVNDPPVSISQFLTTDLNTPVNITLTATDCDNEIISYTITTYPLSGSIKGVLPNITYSPAADFRGNDIIKFISNDGKLNSNTAIITIVTGTDNSDIFTSEDMPVSFTLSTLDSSMENPVFTILSLPLNGNLTGTAPELTYIPSKDTNGSDSFSYSVSGASSEYTFTIYVIPVNDAPDISYYLPITLVEDSYIDITIDVFDADNDELSYSFENPTLGTITGSPPVLKYEPYENLNGIDIFKIIVNDGFVCISSEITLTIMPVNDVPVISGNNIFETNEDKALSINLNVNDIDGDNLNLIISEPPIYGSFSELDFANYRYNPNLNYYGSDKITLKATDGTSFSNPFIITITISPQNDAPSALTNNFYIFEDNVIYGNLNAVDVDEDAISFSIYQSPEKGTLTINDINTGAFSYTPYLNENGIDFFKFNAHDQQTISEPAVISIFISPVNDKPVSKNSLFSTMEDINTTINLFANDVDSTSLSFSIINMPQYGNIQILNPETGEIRYSPIADFFGQDIFTYKISDGFLESDPGIITITVISQNDIPSAYTDNFSTYEDIPFNGVLNGSDPDNDELNFIITNQGTLGRINLIDSNKGTFTYTPDQNKYGIDKIFFQTSDGYYKSYTAQISINITPVNDPPTAQSNTFNINEDSQYNGKLTGSDIDSLTLTYSIISNPQNGDISINNITGDFIYAPFANASGNDIFIYSVSDGESQSNQATITISIITENDPPIAYSNTISTNEDTQYLGKLIAFDSDQDSLIFKITKYPDNGQLQLTNNTTGDFKYIPEINKNGFDSFSFIVNDGTVDSNSETISINIIPVNDPPVTNQDLFITNEDSPIDYTLIANDIDSENIVFTIVEHPQIGSLTILDFYKGIIKYIPFDNVNGSDSFSFKVNDGSLDSNISTINIQIQAVNDSPNAIAANFQISEDNELKSSLNAIDIDSEQLNYIIHQQGILGKITVNNPQTGNFTYIPLENAFGKDNILFKVSDGISESDIQMITITIIPVNDPPNVSNSQYNISEDSSLNNEVLTASDIDSISIVYSITSYPEKADLSINELTGNFDYIPFKNVFGSDFFVYQVSDGSDFSQATVTIMIMPENDTPIAKNDNISTNEDEKYTGKLNSLDYDNDELIYKIASSPNKGQVKLLNSNTGSFEYIPNLNQNGFDIFCFIVNDTTIDSIPACISINIISINDRPTASQGSFITKEDSPKTYTLSVSDEDSQNFQFEIVSAPLSGNLIFLDKNKGLVKYTPFENFYGTDKFSYKVSDLELYSDLKEISIQIEAVNDAPNGYSNIIETSEDTIINDKFNAIDIDSDTLTFSIFKQPELGKLTINNINTGDFSFSPYLNNFGIDSVLFIVSDGTNNSEPASLTIIINPINDPPVAVNSDFNVVEDNNYVDFLSGNDVDSLTLTYLILSYPQKAGITINNKTGEFNYVPELNQTGSDFFIFKISDGAAESNQATVTVQISPENDRPLAYNQKIETQEDTPYSGKFEAFDIDNDIINYIIVDEPVNGKLTLLDSKNGSYRYEPFENFHGNDFISFKVNDGTIDSNPAQITIIIESINDAPETSNGIIVTQEDEAIQYTLQALDIDNDLLSYSIVDQSQKGTVELISPDSNIIKYTPFENESGNDSFTFKANDGKLDSNISQISIQINPVNDQPAAVSDNFETNEDILKNGFLMASDPENDDLVFSIVNQGNLGNVTISNNNNGAFIYNPFKNQNGIDFFTFKVNDGIIDSEPVKITMTINPVNDPPVLNSIINQYTNEDISIFDLVINASDPDNTLEELIIKASSNNNDLISDLELLTHEDITKLSIILKPDAFGESNIIVTAADPEGLTNSKQFTVYVEEVNDKPDISEISDIEILEDTTAKVIFNINDKESPDDKLQINLNSSNNELIQSENIQISSEDSNKILLINPSKNRFGTAQLTIKITDEGGLSSSQSFTINILPVNDQPQISNIANQVIDEDSISSPISFTITDNETSAYSLNINIHSLNNELLSDNNIQLNGEGMNRYIILNPEKNAFGTTNIIITVSDDQGLTKTTQFELIVEPINDIPEISEINDIYITEDTPLIKIPFLITDPDTANESITISAVSSNDQIINPKNIVFEINYEENEIQISPEKDASGNVLISLNISDGYSTINKSFTVFIDEINDAPEIEIIEDQIFDEDTVSPCIDILISDKETKNEQLTISAISSNKEIFPYANYSYCDENSISFTPANNSNGNSIMTITVKDPQGLTNSTSFNITVNPINDSPSISDINDIEFDEDIHSDEISFNINDIETPAEDLIVNAISNDQNIISNNNIIISGNSNLRNLIISPSKDINGQCQIIITVSDSQALSCSEIFNVKINEVYDSPELSDFSDKIIDEDSQNLIIEFTAFDVDTDFNDLTFSTKSSNNDLINNIEIFHEEQKSYIKIKPLLNMNGTSTITVSAEDNTDKRTEKSFLLTVNPVNDPPIAQKGYIFVQEDDIANGKLNANDIDSNEIIFSIISQPEMGILTLTNNLSGDFIYKPEKNEYGIYSFEFIANDRELNSEPEKITLEIEAVNDSPVANAGNEQTIDEAETVYLNAGNSYDIDSIDLTYEWLQTQGKSVILENPYTITTSFTAPDVDAEGDIIVFKLSVTDDYSKTSTDYITININNIPSPSANFDASPTNGKVPLIVNFTDISENRVNSWLWNFGDGYKEITQNPTHTFSSAGNYTVSLKVSGPGGNDFIEKSSFVIVEPAEIKVDFSADIISGLIPHTVSFISNIEGEIDSIEWDFGDGSISNLLNPVHTYNEAGSYTVSLKVYGNETSKDKTYPELIKADSLFISGNILNINNNGLENAWIEIWLKSGNDQKLMGNALSNEDGAYTIYGLPASENFIVMVWPPDNSEYLFEIYNEKNSIDELEKNDYISTINGNQINVNIGLNLAPKNGISGIVYDGINGIENIEVQAFSEKTMFSKRVFTDSDGYYEITGLKSSDDYRVFIWSEKLNKEIYYYSNSQSVFNWDDASLVIPEIPYTNDIDIIVNQNQGAYIKGCVFEKNTNDFINNLWVNAWSDFYNSGNGALTDENGCYTIVGLLNIDESHALQKGYIVEIYSDKYPYQAYNNAFDRENASPVETNIDNINFYLITTGSISGNVSFDKGNHVNQTEIFAFSMSDQLLKQSSSMIDENGFYTISNLLFANDYIVYASAKNYPIIYYNNETDINMAGFINLNKSLVDNIDFVLSKGIVISGTVYIENQTDADRSSIEVNLLSENSNLSQKVYCDYNGYFEFIGLDKNIKDYIIFVRLDGYMPAYYNNTFDDTTAHNLDDAAYITQLNTNINLTLKKGYSIRGKISLNDENIPDIKLIVKSETNSFEIISNDSQPFNYTLNGIVEGYYEISISSDVYYADAISDFYISENIENVNFILNQIGFNKIRGTITGLEAGKRIELRAWSANTQFDKTVKIMGNGSNIDFSITELKPSSDYILELISDDFPELFYNNKNNIDFADYIDISKEDKTIDTIRLENIESTKTISGYVEFPQDIAGQYAVIDAYSISKDFIATVKVEYNNYTRVEYQINQIINSDDYLISINSDNYRKVFYDSTKYGTVDQSMATLIDISDTVEISNINFTLSNGMSISGKIIDTENTGKADIIVNAWSESTNSSNSTISDSNGFYKIEGLENADDFFISAIFNNSIFWYNNMSTVRDRANASTVSSESENINIKIDYGQSITGFVLNKDGIGISNVWIDAWSESKMTGGGAFSASDGKFEISGLNFSKDYMIAAKPQNDSIYCEQKKSNITTGTNNLDFILKEKKGTVISGVITDSRGNEVSNVKIELINISSNKIYKSISSRDGIFEFSGIEKGCQYFIQAWPPENLGFSFYTGDNFLIEKDMTIDIQLKNAFSIQGKITDIENKPIIDALITIISPLYNFIKTTKTDKSGNYNIANILDSSDYSISAKSDGFISQEKTNLSPGSGIDFILVSSGTIKGNIKIKKTGENYENALVQVKSKSRGISNVTISDMYGNYIFKDIEPQDSNARIINDYVITVFAQGYPEQYRGGKKAGDIVDFMLTSGTQNELKGSCNHSFDAAIIIELYTNQKQFIKRTLPDNDHKFVFNGLNPDSQYTLKFLAFDNNEIIFYKWSEEIYTTDDTIDYTLTQSNKKYYKTIKTQNILPENLKSLSHIATSIVPTSVSSNPYIVINWEQPDTNTDISGYYTLFNTNPDYQFNILNTANISPINILQTSSSLLKGDDISCYFHIAVVDIDGNIGETTTLGAFRIDTIPPKNPFVMIPEETTSQTVLLKTGATGASEIYISNMGYGVGGKWEILSASKEWKLSSESGIKKIYIQFRDNAENSINTLAMTKYQKPVINKAPLTYSSQLNIKEDWPSSGTLNASDPDNDGLQYFIYKMPKKGNVTITNPLTGQFFYSPFKDISGTDSFEFYVNDGIIDSETEKVSITIEPVNDEPAAYQGSLKVKLNTPSNGKLKAFDSESDILTYSIVKQPEMGNVQIDDVNNGNYTFYPDNNKTGDDFFTFQISDGNSSYRRANVFVTIYDDNSPESDIKKYYGYIQDNLYNGINDAIVFLKPSKTNIDGKIFQTKTMLAQDGYFEFELKSGTYNLEVFKNGYEKAVFNTINNNEFETEFEFQFENITLNDCVENYISGTVLADGKQISSPVKIYLINNNNDIKEYIKEYISINGDFFICADNFVQTDNYTIIASQDAYYTKCNISIPFPLSLNINMHKIVSKPEISNSYSAYTANIDSFGGVSINITDYSSTKSGSIQFPINSIESLSNSVELEYTSVKYEESELTNGSDNVLFEFNLSASLKNQGAIITIPIKNNITIEDFLNEDYAIYHAANIDELLKGTYIDIVDPENIIAVENGLLSFQTLNLSSFGVGLVEKNYIQTPNLKTTDDDSSSCFIKTVIDAVLDK